MGGAAGSSDLDVKRAIYGYYNGEGGLRDHFDPNHVYVQRVFPAFQDYSGCRGSTTADSEAGLDVDGVYAPILDPAILRRFIPIRPHHGPGTLASDPSAPAMDIAVPTGTKAYAFTNGQVVTLYRGVRTFRPGSGGSQRGSCGNGFNLRGDDGQSYQYCHFDRLAPEVVQGARLEAGQFVGLTGNTGRSTGPHLHFGSPGPRTVARAQSLRDRVTQTVQ